MSETIYGINPVKEALLKKQEVDKLFLHKPEQHAELNQIFKLAQKANIPVSHVPKVKLDRLVKQNHQGVVAKISPVQLVDLENLLEEAFEKTENPGFLLLDQINDVRNFGAILRSAACAGIAGVIISKTGSAPINQEVAKTSSGGLFHVSISKVEHLKDALFYLQAYGVQCIAATERAKSSIYELNLQHPTAIVMGNENRGISPSLQKTVDRQVSIPILGEMDSLNVSVASGVIVYEMLRQRLKS